MVTSGAGIAFIKMNEGFVGEVGNDVGHEVIGYGHDILPGESFPDGISMAGADQLLRDDLKHRFEPVVNSVIPETCTQGQFDALIDFCYNLGASSLRTMVAHGWDNVPTQIPRWNHVNGVVSVGLTRRRDAEVAMFTDCSIPS